MSNDFLPFGTTIGANVMIQADYAAMTARSVGFQSGTALSIQLNKVWRQASCASAMVGQIIDDYTAANAVDDGNITVLEANFLAALRNYLVPGGIQVFTTSSTFTVPAHTTSLVVEVWGGGGGSSGLDSSGAGAGGFSLKLISGLVPGAVIVVTIGAGGAAGTGGISGTAGTNGGTSSFGSYCSATGGGVGGAGGNGVGGDMNLSGGSGQDLDNITGTYANGTISHARGGDSPRGGFSGTINAAGAVNPPTVPGGGGACNGAVAAGQAGATGMIVVRW